jgi:hypothetical protein
MDISSSGLVSMLEAMTMDADSLRAWNAANESAFDAAEPQAPENIRLTAAFILSRKPLDSMREQDIHALVLFAKTLDAHAVIEGFADGFSGALKHKANEILKVFEPGDMNIAHSTARVDALLDKPASLIADARAMGSWILENSDSLGPVLTGVMASCRQSAAQLMAADNMSHLAGSAMGVFVANAMDPVQKLHQLKSFTADLPSGRFALGGSKDWDAYAEKLGTGMVPPGFKPSRDFSGQMFYQGADGRLDRSWVNYNIDASRQNGIEASLNRGILKFTVYAKGDRQEYGSGTEIFLSAFSKFQVSVKDIMQIDANWTGKKHLSSNHEQLISALNHGASLESATRQTYTGRMAERIGLTRVIQSEDPLQPIFTHPDWGAGKQMNEYSLAFARAHGRSGIEVMPAEYDADAAPKYIWDQLMMKIYDLPIEQRKTVMDQVQKNYEAFDCIYNRAVERGC